MWDANPGTYASTDNGPVTDLDRTHHAAAADTGTHHGDTAINFSDGDSASNTYVDAYDADAADSYADDHADRWYDAVVLMLAMILALMMMVMMVMMIPMMMMMVMMMMLIVMIVMIVVMMMMTMMMVILGGLGDD